MTTRQSDCNKQLIASFFKMTKMLFCPFEDENKNCIKWCYPPSFAKNLTLLSVMPINQHGSPAAAGEAAMAVAVAEATTMAMVRH